MKTKENEIHSALNIMRSFKKFASIQEAIATLHFFSDTQKRLKKEGKLTFAELNNICKKHLDNGCATQEELRLKSLAENYIATYEPLHKICSTIAAYEKNDFLQGYSKADYEKQIIRFVNYC